MEYGVAEEGSCLMAEERGRPSAARRALRVSSLGGETSLASSDIKPPKVAGPDQAEIMKKMNLMARGCCRYVG